MESGCRLRAWIAPTKDYSTNLLPTYILEMSDTKHSLVVSACHDWPQVGIKFYFLFHSQFPNKTYSSVLFHTPQTQWSSKTNHSCLTGSTPCFLLTFPQGYLAYSWPLILTEKHIRREMKPTEGEKTRCISLISYQQATIGRVNEQILSCYTLSSSGALQLRF